jgi:hypothetical protein
LLPDDASPHLLAPAPTAAVLTGTTPDQAQRLLDLLARAHLIHPTSPGRYRMNDLLRASAFQLAATKPGVPEVGRGHGLAVLDRAPGDVREEG